MTGILCETAEESKKAHRFDQNAQSIDLVIYDTNTISGGQVKDAFNQTTRSRHPNDMNETATNTKIRRNRRTNFCVKKKLARLIRIDKRSKICLMFN
jgi:hypothetical protein